MNAEHPSLQELEEFVGGPLVASADFEAHLVHCAACAQALGKQARVQEVCEFAARKLRRPNAWVHKVRGPGYVMGAVMAVAASLLWVVHGPGMARASESVPSQHRAQLERADAGWGDVILASLDAGPRG